jgi:membrane protease YdiL (CAAX protease family)
MSEGISIAPWEFKAEFAAAVCIVALASLLYVALAFVLGDATQIVFNLYLSLATALSVVVSISLGTRASSGVLLSLTTVTFALLFEEALVNGLDPYAGFTLAFIVALMLPLAGSILAVGSGLSEALQVAGLMFASRLVFIPFPARFLKISLALPSAYALIIALVVAFLVIKRISLKRVGFAVGSYSLFKQVSVGLSVGLVSGLVEYLILKPSPIQLAGDALQAILYVVIVMTAFVGLGEEMLFRGLIQQTYQRVLPTWSAILMASIQFAVMHIGWQNPLEILFAYAMGIFFGYMFWKTKSLITPVIAHSLGNIAMFLIAAYPDLMLDMKTIVFTILVATALLISAALWRNVPKSVM